MKVGMFADSHYSSAEITCGCRYNNRSLEKIKEAYQYFKKEKCDIVICLGDLIDHEEKHCDEIIHLKEVADVLRKQEIKTTVIMGNHDAFSFTKEEFYDILGLEFYPKTIKYEDNTLLFVDACYFKNGNHYMPGDTEWTNTFIPCLNELECELNKAQDNCYIFIHQNVDLNIREDHRVYNDEDFRILIEKSKKVKTVYQGHYHPGKTSEHNGIKYITLPAMCEGDKRYFVVEI